MTTCLGEAAALNPEVDCERENCEKDAETHDECDGGVETRQQRKRVCRGW